MRCPAFKEGGLSTCIRYQAPVGDAFVRTEDCRLQWTLRVVAQSAFRLWVSADIESARRSNAGTWREF